MEVRCSILPNRDKVRIQVRPLSASRHDLIQCMNGARNMSKTKIGFDFMSVVSGCLWAAGWCDGSYQPSACMQSDQHCADSQPAYMHKHALSQRCRQCTSNCH